MRTITKEACSEWLAARSILEAPYGKSPSSTQHYEQFHFPGDAQRISLVARSLFNVIPPFGEALLHFTDWPFYQPDEMAVIAAIRAASGEHRRLIDAPGHVFDSSEPDLLVGLLALAISYQWDAYLYFDHGVTFLSWEGELLDVWTSEHAHVAAIRGIFHPQDASAAARKTD